MYIVYCVYFNIGDEYSTGMCYWRTLLYSERWCGEMLRIICDTSSSDDYGLNEFVLI